MRPSTRRSWKFFSRYSRTLNSTRFVTVYDYVQSNIQHVSPASGGKAIRPPPRLQQTAVFCTFRRFGLSPCSTLFVCFQHCASEVVKSAAFKRIRN